MTRIQIRRDTSNNWATYNPILADGEFALETDTRKLKIGNGTQPYNDLEYQGGGDLPDNVTTQGNTFNGANQLVQLDSSGKLPAIDGSQLTNLPSGGTAPENMVTTDTIQTITGSKTLENSKIILSSTTTGTKQFVRLTVPTNGSGGSITTGLISVYTDVDTYKTKINIGSSSMDLDIQSSNLTSNGSAVLTLNTLPTGNLKYWTGTEEQYTGLEAKDADTLYRTTDTNKVYLGTIQIGG